MKRMNSSQSTRLSWSTLYRRVGIIIVLALLTIASMSAGATNAAAATGACTNDDQGLLSKLKQEGTGHPREQLVLTDIDFLNTKTGRVAGSGFLIGTSDAGCHWQAIYTGQWNFAQIDFPNNVQGWALATVGEQPTMYLLRTEDGGSHWKRLNTPAPFIRIQLLNKSTGFGYTSSGAYVTKDGGVSWSKVKVPANTRGATFATEQDGWATVVRPGKGYALVKTVNGGKSWSLALDVPFKDPVQGDMYVKDNQVYALLYGGSGMSQVSYALYGSNDRGTHWRQVLNQATAGGGPAPGGQISKVHGGPANPGGHPGNMELIGRQTAFLAGGSPAGGKVTVGYTADAGVHWTNNNPVVEGYAARISFTDSKTGYMAVIDSSSPAVYATQDSGKHWSQLLRLPSL